MANSTLVNFSSLANTTLKLNMGNPCDFLSPSRSVITGKTLAYSFLIPATLFGNVLTIIVIYSSKTMRNSMDLFIVNMALSNLVVPCVVLPYQIVKTTINSDMWLVDGLAGEIMCKFVFIVADVCPVVSIYSLIGMTADRFLAVVYRSTPTRKSLRVRIILIWILSFGLFSPYLYTFRLHYKKNGVLYCSQRWAPNFDDHAKAHRMYIAVILVFAVIIPFCLLTIMYSAILITMTRCLPYFKPQTRVGRQRKHKAIRSTTTQALALVVVFGICYGPYNVILLIFAFAWNGKFSSCERRLLFFFAQFLTYTYSFISPSIYFMFFPKYKRAIKRVLNCQAAWETVLRSSLSFLEINDTFENASKHRYSRQLFPITELLRVLRVKINAQSYVEVLYTISMETKHIESCSCELMSCQLQLKTMAIIYYLIVVSTKKKRLNDLFINTAKYAQAKILTKLLTINDLFYPFQEQNMTPKRSNVLK